MRLFFGAGPKFGGRSAGRFGTLFERGFDPSKRAQLGAHYTDRDKIMLIIEPVVIRPWLVNWNAEKGRIVAELERAETAKSSRRRKRRNAAEQCYRAFLNWFRAFTVLDPASALCGTARLLALKGVCPWLKYPLPVVVALLLRARVCP